MLLCRRMLVMYSQRPNELMVKRVAMLGCSALVLAHAVKQDRQLGNTYAGRGVHVRVLMAHCSWQYGNNWRPNQACHAHVGGALASSSGVWQAA